MNTDKHVSTINSDASQQQVVSTENKFFLSDKATYLLSHIVDREKIPVAKIGDEFKDELATLLDKRLVELDPIYQGYIKATEAGKRALDKRVALVYPFGQHGTISDYNNTLNSQTPGAKDALIRAMATEWESYSRSLHKDTVGTLISAMVRARTFHRLRPTVNQELYLSLRDTSAYYLGNEQNGYKVLEQIRDNLFFWDAFLNDRVKSIVEKAGSITFTSPITFSEGDMKNIVINDTGELIISYNGYSGDDYTIPFDEIEVPAKLRVFEILM